MKKIGLAVAMVGLATGLCGPMSEAQTPLEQGAVQACADHMKQHWLNMGDDWFTRVVTPDSVSVKKNYFIQARALKPDFLNMPLSADDIRGGVDRQGFVFFRGRFRTTEKGAWSAWTELRKDGVDAVYNCGLRHQNNIWTVQSGGSVGSADGSLGWTDRVLVRPAASDIPR